MTKLSLYKKANDGFILRVDWPEIVIPLTTAELELLANSLEIELAKLADPTPEHIFTISLEGCSAKALAGFIKGDET